MCSMMWYNFQMMADWSAGCSDVKTALRRSRKLSTCIIHWGQTYLNWWLAGIRKEIGSNPHQKIRRLFIFEKFSALYIVNEFDLYSYPFPTCRQIQLFLCKKDVSYREHILTPYVPLQFKLVITENMNSVVIIQLWFEKYFSWNFPPKFIYCLSLSTAQNPIYKDSVTSDTQSNTALSLQVFFPHASAYSWLWQSTFTWLPTIRRYGIQRAVYVQISPIGNGNQNVGGLLSLRCFYSRLCQHLSSSYHEVHTFIDKEVRNVCVCK